MKKRKILVASTLLFLAAVYLENASWPVRTLEMPAALMAHRGVHQTFPSGGLTNETCTAAIINPPIHGFLENTLPSIKAALDHGAGWIEIDIQPTTDGEFVVFHDWTLDCRTDGSGRTRDHSLAQLKALDIGYGYTADKGQSYPFRGQFSGAMPTLTEVLQAFPEAHFMINMKSRSEDEARALSGYVPAADWPRLSVTAHEKPAAIIRKARPDIPVMSRQQARTCMKSYILTGWSGHIPASCHNMWVPVPVNMRRLVWGWPHRFEQRLQSVGSRSMLLGPLVNGKTTGIDSDHLFKSVPGNYQGIVMTNKIEEIGPLSRGD